MRMYTKTIMGLGRENFFLKQEFGIANNQVRAISSMRTHARKRTLYAPIACALIIRSVAAPCLGCRSNSLQAMRLNQLKPKPETLNPKPKTLQMMQLNQEVATVQEQLHCLR